MVGAAAAGVAVAVARGRSGAESSPHPPTSSAAATAAPSARRRAGLHPAPRTAPGRCPCLAARLHARPARPERGERLLRPVHARPHQRHAETQRLQPAQGVLAGLALEAGLDLPVGGQPRLRTLAVVEQLPPPGLGIAVRAEEHLQQHAVAVLGLDRLDPAEPLAQDLPALAGQREQPLVGTVRLRDAPPAHEPVGLEALEHRVELAPRGRPDEADRPLRPLVQLVARGLPAPGQQPQNRELGARCASHGPRQHSPLRTMNQLIRLSFMRTRL
jgi:hypothetical protein